MIIYHVSIVLLMYVSMCPLSSVSIRSVFTYLSSISGYNLRSYVSTYLLKYLSIILPLLFLFSSFQHHLLHVLPVNRKPAADIRTPHQVL